MIAEYDDELDYVRPKNRPLVSIVVPAYNAGKYIGRCLASISSQTYSNLQVIVVCAPSTDDTFEKILQHHDDRVIAIEEVEKSNCATARNKGKAYSSGDYVLYLDADDWLEPYSIERLVEAMEANSRLRWCAGYVKSVNPDGTYSVDKNLPGIHSVMFRKSQKAKFDQSLPAMDDVDMYLRIRTLPHMILPEVLENYYINPAGLTQTKNLFGSDIALARIALKHGAWDMMPRIMKDTVIHLANRITGIDMVKKKKEIFG